MDALISAGDPFDITGPFLDDVLGGLGRDQ